MWNYLVPFACVNSLHGEPPPAFSGTSLPSAINILGITQENQQLQTSIALNQAVNGLCYLVGKDGTRRTEASQTNCLARASPR
jgi:hypothetical protein